MSVGAVAIVVVEKDESPGCGLPTATSHPAVIAEPLGCIEILGKSSLERMLAVLRKNELDGIQLVVEQGILACAPAESEASSGNLKIQVAEDVWIAVAQTVCELAEQGRDHVFICRGTEYVECDLMDLLQFHRLRRQIVTRAFDRDGMLDLWVVDCNKAKETNLQFLFDRDQPFAPGSGYFVREYVNRLACPADVRRLVVDVFRRQCQISPEGREVRPGVWLGEGAQVHKRARIVAPAYIGRGSKIREDALITRYSNVESLCHIDYGTVIEDSSVLANSYVGIWLDVSHAIVRGNKLLNLARNVGLEISDSNMLRELPVAAKDVKREPAADVALAFAPSE